MALLGLPRRNMRCVAVFAAAPLALALAVGSVVPDVGFVFRDPAAVARLPPYLGFFSNLGVLAWTVAATASLLAALVLPRSEARDALAAAGVFALVLALDDVFMLHESVLPFLGVPERLVLGGYAVCAVAYLFVFRAFHRRMDWHLLLAALALLGASVALDLFGRERLLLEDSTKFAGIAAWCAYHGLAARYWLRRAAGRTEPYSSL